MVSVLNFPYLWAKPKGQDCFSKKGKTISNLVKTRGGQTCHIVLGMFEVKEVITSFNTELMVKSGDHCP